MSFADHDRSYLQTSRTPLDDCPPFDPTLWGGKDCFFLTKLLSSPEIREELAEQGWNGDLNPVVNRPRVLKGRAEPKHAGSSSAIDSNQAYLAPNPPTIVERARSLGRALLFFMGLIPEVAVGLHGEYTNVGAGWLSQSFLGRILWGTPCHEEGHSCESMNAQLAASATDNLQQRLETALGVGDTVAAAQIAAELARRRATIQSQPPVESPFNQSATTTNVSSRVSTSFWSQ